MPNANLPSPAQAAQMSKLALAQAELSGAASIAMVLFNAAQAQQAGQLIELANVGTICARIVANGVVPAP